MAALSAVLRTNGSMVGASDVDQNRLSAYKRSIGSWLITPEGTFQVQFAFRFAWSL